uniref:Protein phosphatase 1 regulatory subunit 14B n=1 Tax=Arion vulgaris TaxID=1028688 RepID=A0A0B6XZ38_9EUPU
MSRNPFRKSVGFYEVGLTTYKNNREAEKAYTQTNQMATSYSPPSKPPSQESPKNVDFDLKDQHKENKKKYLTAKYGAHQMLLIKKRLGVEMWIFDELRKLYDSENDDHDCELELEDILNLDTDSERRHYVLEQLQDAKQSTDLVNKFIEELLIRAKTL